MDRAVDPSLSDEGGHVLGACHHHRPRSHVGLHNTHISCVCCAKGPTGIHLSYHYPKRRRRTHSVRVPGPPLLIIIQLSLRPPAFNSFRV